MNVANTGGGVEPFARHAAQLHVVGAAGAEPDSDRDEARDDAPPEEPPGDALAEAGRREQEYVRRRLAEELGREPSEEELSEWLRRHTEGY